jgi:hypothetical protein
MKLMIQKRFMSKKYFKTIWKKYCAYEFQRFCFIMLPNINNIFLYFFKERIYTKMDFELTQFIEIVTVHYYI